VVRQRRGGGVHADVTIYTIGHSTRALDDFLALLAAHDIRQLADVRTIPKSRRHPHFAGDALSASLHDAGIVYRHVAALGGLRKPRADSSNTGWRHEGFRGYADYMETPAFAQAVDELIGWAGEARTAVMCAEAVWWQCHRRLLSDALVARDIEVRHIMTAASAPRHELTEFARIEAARVRYPGLW
jgi:uncharacterized protein (DUF488 family)